MFSDEKKRLSNKDSNSVSWVKAATLTQPELRFKPRNDFERIIDSIDIYGTIKSNSLKNKRTVKSDQEFVGSSDNNLEFDEYKMKKELDQLQLLNNNTNLKAIEFRTLDDELCDLQYEPNSTPKVNFTQQFLGNDLYWNRYWQKKVFDIAENKKILSNITNSKQGYEEGTNCKTYFKGVQDLTQSHHDRIILIVFILLT